MKTQKVILVINTLIILFLFCCKGKDESDCQIIKNLNNYSGKNEDFKEILFDYNEISKDDKHLKSYKKLINELSSFVKKNHSEIQFKFVEKRNNGEVYSLFKSSEKSKRRYLLIRNNKIVSPQCFQKGDKITFCF